MRVAGCDFSSRFVDIVTVPYDEPGEPGQPVWHRFALHGQDAFDRARSVAQALPGRYSAFWDEILAVGIEHPGGRHGTGPLLRVQGAILSCIPPRMLVEPFPPAKWRKLVGLPGNASKYDVLRRSIHSLIDGRIAFELPRWPQDAHDAHLIALATRQQITTEQAA